MARTMNFGPSSVARFAPDAAVLHVRFAGESFDLRLPMLGIGPAASDREIKRAVAAHLMISPGRLANCAIDRHANGNLTIRPKAVFG